MFNELDAKYLDGRRILKVEEFETGEGLHPQKGVHFADEKEPKVAVVHEDELKYLTFDNEEDSIKLRGPAFSTATASVQQKIMDDLRFFNVKFKELKPLMDNLQDTFVVFSDRFNRAIFGDENGKYDRYSLKLSTIIDCILKAEKQVDYSGFSENAKAMLKCAVDIDLGFEEAKYVLAPMKNGFDSLHLQACEAVCGISGNEMRLRDMIEFIEEYEAKHGIPDEIKAMQGQPKQEAPAVDPAIVEEERNLPDPLAAVDSVPEPETPPQE